MHTYILHTSSFTKSGSTSVALNLWHFYTVNCISSLDCAPLDHTSLGHTYLGTPIKGFKEVKVEEATEMTGMKENSYNHLKSTVSCRASRIRAQRGHWMRMRWAGAGDSRWEGSGLLALFSAAPSIGKLPRCFLVHSKVTGKPSPHLPAVMTPPPQVILSTGATQTEPCLGMRWALMTKYVAELGN